MKYKIHIYKSNQDGQYYWRLKSRNGRIIAQGEGYRTKRNLLKTIKPLADLLKATVVW